MKTKTKLNLLIITLGIIFALSTISNNNFNENQRINGGTSQIQDDTNLNNPKISRSFWNNFSFIHIDGNWSTAADYEWCRGDGSWSNPYAIENITIDASSSPTGSGIFISNSKNDYFIIRNCTVFNAPGSWYEPNAGITLENSNNGTLINNNCSNNVLMGIHLFNNCENNTITGNIANDYQLIGIYLAQNSHNNTISGNTANNNGVHGIRLGYGCNNNTISGNTANNNDENGILIWDDCNKNTVSGNTANNNGVNGIYLYLSDNNTISGNTISNDGTTDQNYGIYINNDCDDNTIIGNLIKDNQNYGIYVRSNCQNNLIYHNSLIGNGGWQARDDGTNNHWNNSAIGNYWDNHTSPDTDNNGIVDIPFTWIVGSANSEDNHPLSFSPVIFADGIIIDDYGLFAPTWSRTADLNLWCTGSGTYSDPYIIDGLEITSDIPWRSGITIYNSEAYFIIQDCLIYSTENNGIYLHNVNNSRIIDNECINNGASGIVLYISNNNSVIGNLISNNDGKGIYIGAEGNSGTIYGCYNNISRNIITDNDMEGIHICADGWGTAIVKVNNNTISGNTISANEEHGILLEALQEENSVVELKNTNITSNTLIENEGAGILLDNCSYTILTENKLYGNGIVFTELNPPNTLKYLTHTIDITNTANDKTIYYYTSEIGLGADDFTDAGQIILMFCQDSVISDLDVSNASIGIYVYLGTNITIYNNNASHGYVGMLLIYLGESNITGNIANYNELAGIYLVSQSNDNDIIQNTANNNYYGIALENSHANLISGNTLLNNTICLYQENCMDNVLIGNDCGKAAAGVSSGSGGGGGSGDGEEAIPGYNMFILIGVICIISTVLIKKRRK